MISASKYLKKVLSVLLVIAMLLANVILFTSIVSAEEIDVWDGTVDSSWYTDFSSTKVAVLTTPEQFAALQSGGVGSCSGWTIKLGGDIYLNTGNAADWATTPPANSWNPYPGFAGILDGCGYSVYGLYVSLTTTHAGLFGYLNGTGVTVKDLNIRNAFIRGTERVGSIAGMAKGTSAIFTNVYSDAILVGTGSKYIGGFLGYKNAAQTTVQNCWFNGTIDCSTVNTIGGIVGNADSGTTLVISNCLVSGTVKGNNYIGGILGNGAITASGCQIENCLVTGSVSGASTVDAMAGSLSIPANYTFSNCYTTGTSSYATTVTAEEIAGESATTTLSVFDFTNTWKTVTGSAPTLNQSLDIEGCNWYNSNRATKTATISTVEEFEQIQIAAVEKSNYLSGWTLNLGADLWFNPGLASDWYNGTNLPENNWTPVGVFKGMLNGNGHSLNGIYCNVDGDKAALFAELNGGTVQNLSVFNSCFIGEKKVATIVGDTRGSATVQNVYSDAYLHSSVTTEGSFSGGIAGNAANSGLVITGCQFDGYLVADRVSTGVNGMYPQKVGGILGDSNGATIENCLVTGTVCGATQVGGILGCAHSNISRVENSVFAGKVVVTRPNDGVTYSGSIVGVVWKNLTTTVIDNCYYKSSYAVIYPNTNTAKSYPTEPYALLSGASLATNDIYAFETCEDFADLSAEVWILQCAEEYLELPILKQLDEQLSDSIIYYCGYQTSNDGRSIRILALLGDIDLDEYSSVSLKMELVDSAGTRRSNIQNSTLYSSVLANGNSITAESLGGTYFYTLSIGFSESKIFQMRITPMLTRNDGTVISGRLINTVVTVTVTE